MNKQEYEQAKQIIEDAPEGATHFDSENYYYKKETCYEWLYCGNGTTVWDSDDDYGSSTIRSLSDIKTMIKQYETIEKLKSVLNDFIYEEGNYTLDECDKEVLVVSDDQDNANIAKAMRLLEELAE